MAIEYHPSFVRQFAEMSTDDDNLEVLGEIKALTDALDQYGHEIEGEDHDDPSHPIVISRLAMFALRRTPPTQFTPTAERPPIIRIPYVWFRTDEGEVPVVMLIGDKTSQGNHWYPAQKELIETKLVPQWENANPGHKAIVRRTK